MTALADASLGDLPRTRWWPRVIAMLAIVLAFGGAAYAIKSLIDSPAAPRRQIARISILPDTPPPPPPPREEKKPEPPKEEPKQVVREEQLKQDVPKPANEPIKMEGTAGDGPSAFAAGSVSKDYQGGLPGSGASAPASIADRAQERFYANTARSLLRDEIEKHLKPEAGEVVASIAVWVDNDGRIRKIDLASGASPKVEDDLRSALDETSRLLRLPSHNGLTQPMRFRMTMRSGGATG